MACSESITPLPIPRPGMLITRLRLMSSCGIDDPLEVRERVLDLAALVKRCPR